MLKNLLVVSVIWALGFIAGQAYKPEVAKATSVNNIVGELRLTRQAIEDIGRNMDCP